MDIQKEREAFECEFKQTDYYIAHGDLSTLMLCDDQYALDDVQVSFEMWRAAKDQMVPEWISVEDEFPKKNLKVLLNLVTRKNGKPIKCIGFYSIEPDEEPCFVLDDNFTELKGVTHWVRLPDSPKAQEQSHD